MGTSPVDRYINSFSYFIGVFLMISYYSLFISSYSLLFRIFSYCFPFFPIISYYFSFSACPAWPRHSGGAGKRKAI